MLCVDGEREELCEFFVFLLSIINMALETTDLDSDVAKFSSDPGGTLLC